MTEDILAPGAEASDIAEGLADDGTEGLLGDDVEGEVVGAGTLCSSIF